MGFDISEAHVSGARARVPKNRAVIEVADFFAVDWDKILERLPAPVLILGNPPWVTNAALGAMSSNNLPAKRNFKRHAGLDAMTGKSNFDISEWMLIRLIEAAHTRPFTLAMLCKASVARRVMEHAATQGWQLEGEVRAIDARLHFAAAVDAVLLSVHNATRTQPFRNAARGQLVCCDLRWPVFPGLDATRASHAMGVSEGRTYSDLDGYRKTRDLEGSSELEWRSGIKHDCASVMELEITGDGLTNGLGESIQLERELVFPLLKGSDLANGRVAPRRRVIITQRHLGDDTHPIRARAPALWRYLERHRDQLAARKSSIYRGQPPFAMFGIGDYAFAPYKVAICGLYKKLVFTVVRPVDGQPVMVDDTAYFLPCDTEHEATALARALNGPTARMFFEARVFWDAKRPINKALLQSLSLDALLHAEGRISPLKPGRAQQLLAF